MHVGHAYHLRGFEPPRHQESQLSHPTLHSHAARRSRLISTSTLSDALLLLCRLCRHVLDDVPQGARQRSQRSSDVARLLLPQDADVELTSSPAVNTAQLIRASLYSCGIHPLSGERTVTLPAQLRLRRQRCVASALRHLLLAHECMLGKEGRVGEQQFLVRRTSCREKVLRARSISGDDPLKWDLSGCIRPSHGHTSPSIHRLLARRCPHGDCRAERRGLLRLHSHRH